MVSSDKWHPYRGTSLIRSCPLPQDHHRALDINAAKGGAVSYERGNPVFARQQTCREPLLGEVAGGRHARRYTQSANENPESLCGETDEAVKELK